jgi:acyl carrier protein
MSDQQILDTCSRILGDLLEDDSIVLGMETTRDQVPGWDSFAYVHFIVMVEQRFGVKFRVAEVESFENVGAIVRRIAALQAAR